MTTTASRREMVDAAYRAFIEGTYARLLGEKLSGCPYAARTHAADSWELGWLRVDDFPNMSEWDEHVYRTGG